MPIQWRDAMSLHNKTVDSDHKYLIRLINSVEDAVNAGDTTDAVNNCLDILEDYAGTHFQREEALMAKAGYPDARTHRDKHSALMQSLSDIRKKLSAVDTDRPEGREVSLDYLTELLRRWLLDHVLSEDLKMKPWLSRI